MSSPRPMAIDDLVALSDAQLGEFMEKHRHHDGSIQLPVDGWDRLSKEERERLAERLQSIQRASINHATAGSHQLDLDKLDALLRNTSPRRDSFSQDRLPRSERQTESPEETLLEVYQRRETKAYNDLIRDGGRALYPIDLLESVSQDPHAYRDMLRPFWRGFRHWKISENDELDEEQVFQRQRLRWQNFRMWQVVNRRIEDDKDEKDFLEFAERVKRNYRKVGWDKYADELEANPTQLKEPGGLWYFTQRHRDWQRQHQRERGCEGILDYEKAMKARLARHGFKRTFHLAEDPKQQDQLTTWIEYLGFEYWWLDRHTATFERLKPIHDEAWEKLKREGMVQDDETPEFVRTEESALGCQRDIDDAREALQDAESKAKRVYQKTQLDPSRLSIPAQQRAEMLVKARENLQASQKELDFLIQRSNQICHFVESTELYVDATEDVAYLTNILEWALAELDAIDAEVTGATSDCNSRKRRQAPTEDVGLVQSNSKRQRLNGRKHGPHLSNEAVVEAHGRVLRSRSRPSTDINRQSRRSHSHDTNDTYPGQNGLIQRAAEQVPEPEPEPVTPKGTSRKRKRVTFKDDPLVQSGPTRLKPSSRGQGAAGTTGMTQRLDQHQKERDTGSSGRVPVRNVPSQQITQGLRRSSRLWALRPERGISLAGGGSRFPSDLGSRYLPVDKLLEKRVRRRGRGRITEYLVKFSGSGSSPNLWTSACELPHWAIKEFEQLCGG
ncbi:Chromo domain-like protein [Metarhizium album ARSEF 1941]|uniref:Chromo domain-like protein n=1 Tax=Metarhizium album (strain ARSEF 1941) TaxID=1081103 RepID=A0A0B2WUQ0_METAS|nr:Chromo domain-like protein [Metarhizium album ARSEF 1941]KHN99766.1 Chromo domain-like protein [Metarhizium album ARSEF 1941]